MENSVICCGSHIQIVLKNNMNLNIDINSKELSKTKIQFTINGTLQTYLMRLKLIAIYDRKRQCYTVSNNTKPNIKRKIYSIL